MYIQGVFPINFVCIGHTKPMHIWECSPSCNRLLLPLEHLMVFSFSIPFWQIFVALFPSPLGPNLLKYLFLIKCVLGPNSSLLPTSQSGQNPFVWPLKSVCIVQMRDEMAPTPAYDILKSKPYTWPLMCTKLQKVQTDHAYCKIRPCGHAHVYHQSTHQILQQRHQQLNAQRVR
jgi:hypothetical protein